MSVREPGPQIVQHRTGQFADLIVSAVGRCPERAGQFAPSVTVKNIGPVPAGAFNVAVDVGVFDSSGGAAVSTAAIVRVPGLAAGAGIARAASSPGPRKTPAAARPEDEFLAWTGNADRNGAKYWTG